MALKDLVVSHAELTEEQIEKIVAPYARFDPTAKSIVLLPSAMTLSNRQRVIIYLVALRGWPFVLSDDTPPTSATPAELERSLQIPGGTLRPILKELKDSRLIETTEGRYSANPVTFPFLEEQLEGAGSAETRRRAASPARKRSKEPEEADPSESTSDDGGSNGEETRPQAAQSGKPAKATPRKRGRRDATASGGGPLVRLRELIAEGWFSQPRTVRDIVTELASRGATYRGQDLTRQMIILTRSRELRRTSQAAPGSSRPVWHYQS